MIPVFAPQIARLVDVGAALLQGAPAQEALLQAIAEAEQFHQTSAARFHYWKTSAALTDAAVPPLMEEIDGAFNARARALDGLRQALLERDLEKLAGWLDKVQQASHDALDLSKQLEARTALLPTLSPIPYVDDFMRVGVNVYNGGYNQRALYNKLPIMLSLVESLEEQRALFRAGHPQEAALYDELGRDIEDLQHGVGAIYTYIDAEAPEKADLLIGLKLLGVASTNVYNDLRKMDALRRSANPYLLAAQQRVAAGETAEAVADLRAWVEREREEVARFQREFLVPPAVRAKYVPEIDRVLAELGEALDAVQGGDAAALEQVAALEEDLHRNAHALFEQTLERRSYGADVEMASLAEAVRGAADSVVPDALLAHHIRAVEQRNRGLSRRLGQLRIRGDFELRRARRALVAELQGLENLQPWFLTRDRDALARGLELLDAQHGMVAGIEELLARKEAEQSTVSCIRCGAQHMLGTSFCTQCRAMLPVLQDFEAPTVDVVAQEHGLTFGGGRAAVSEMFADLEQVCHAHVQGEADDAELGAVLDLFDSRIALTRAQYAMQVEPTVKKNPQDELLGACAEQFMAVFDKLEQGITMLRHGDASGLAVAMEAGESLEQLHGQLSELAIEATAAEQAGG